MKKLSISVLSFIIVIATCILPCSSRAAIEGDTKWTRNMEMTTETLNSITYGNGLFVAAGDNGAISTSSDGVKWTFANSGTDSWLGGIACNGKVYAAVGRNGTIVTSSDGTTWTKQELGSNYIFSDIIWDGKVFRAVGGTGVKKETDPYPEMTKGAILTSSDGKLWTTQTIDEVNNISCVIWNGSQYIIGGYKLGGGEPKLVILSSSDCVNWTNGSVEKYGGTMRLCGGVWTGSQYILLEYSGVVLMSADGVKWSRKSIGNYLEDIAWNGSILVTVGMDSIQTSTDGISWTKRANTKQTLKSVIWNGSKFVAVGANGIVYMSQDGISWEEKVKGENRNFTDIVWDGKQFVSVSGDTTIFTSSDGATWKANRQEGLGELNYVAFNKKRYIAAGGFNWGRGTRSVLFASDDGINWKAATVEAAGGFEDEHSMKNNELYGGASNDNVSIIVGGSGRVLKSADGIKWSYVNTGTDNTLNNAVWNGNQFAAVGYKGTILTSPDGISWTKRNSGTDCSISDIVWNGTKYVAVGGTSSNNSPNGKSEGIVLISNDGDSWRTVNIPVQKMLYSLLWNGEQYAAVGEGGTILTSSDGMNWTTNQTGIGNTLRGLAWNGMSYVVVGERGAVLQGMKISTTAKKADSVQAISQPEKAEKAELPSQVEPKMTQAELSNSGVETPYRTYMIAGIGLLIVALILLVLYLKKRNHANSTN